MIERIEPRYETPRRQRIPRRLSRGLEELVKGLFVVVSVWLLIVLMGVGGK